MLDKVWTTQQELALRELVKLGKNVTYTEIAIRLGKKFGKLFTRQGCINKARELGIVKAKERVKEKKPEPKKQPKKQPKTRVKPVVIPKLRFEEKKAPNNYQFKKIPIPVGALRLRFSQLTPTSCRYELGPIDRKPHEYRFCGLPVDNAPYCVYHTAACFTQPRIPTKDLVRKR